MSDTIIFKELNEVQSIVGTLVENIYNDDSYQEYLNELQENDSVTSTKKAQNIKQTFTDLRVFNTHSEPLFLANDIGVIIGASNVNQMVKNYTATEKISGHIIDHKGRTSKKIFLTKHGIYRILFNSKTKLAEVFRGFIYKLIDHMFYNENTTLKKIIKIYAADNKELVVESILELNNNVEKYQTLYEEEQKERIELEISNTYNEMYIKQLKNEKDNILDKLDDIQYGDDIDETVVALEFLKKKFLKEFTISLVYPSILDEIFNAKKSPYDLINEKYTLNAYKNNFNFIVDRYHRDAKISPEDTFYLNVAYKALDKSDKVLGKDDKDDKEDKDDNDESVPVASDYVMDRKKFAELIEILKVECDVYQSSKSKKISSIIFKTSIEHIKLVARNILTT